MVIALICRIKIEILNGLGTTLLYQGKCTMNNEMTIHFECTTCITSKPLSIVGAKAKIDISSLSQYL